MNQLSSATRCFCLESACILQQISRAEGVPLRAAVQGSGVEVLPWDMSPLASWGLYACSPFGCVNSLWVLWFPPTVQRHTGQVNW